MAADTEPSAETRVVTAFGNQICILLGRCAEALEKIANLIQAAKDSSDKEDAT